jgi:putative membrane protein
MNTRHPNMKHRVGLMTGLRTGLFAGGLLAGGLLACSQDEPAKSASNPDPNTVAPASPPATDTNATASAAATATSPGAQNAPNGAQNAPSPTTTSWAANTTRDTDPSPDQAPAPASTPMLTNAQILGVTRTADEGEIAQARLAQAKSKSARVLALAAMILRDHRDAEKKADALEAKDNLTRQSSPTSESLQTDADGFTRALKADTGAGFDKDYVQTQIREHEAVLDMIDRKLMPSASDADVKAYLEQIRVAVASHLEHARQVETDMERQAQN